jgi:hypothetical protein
LRRTCSSAISGVCVAFSIALEISDAARDKLKEGMRKLWTIMADNDLRSGSTLEAFHRVNLNHSEIANLIFERIKEFPFHRTEDGINMGWDALEGVLALLKAIDAPNGPTDLQIKRMILSMFNKRWIDQTEHLVDLLRLIRKVDVELPDSAKEGFYKLLQNVQHSNHVRGTWFQLSFIDELGLSNIKHLEFPRRGSKRGIDVVTNDGRFFELKAGTSFSFTEVRQMIDQLSERPITEVANGWRQYKHISNVADETDIPSMREQHAGLFTRELEIRMRTDPNSLPAGLREFSQELRDHIENRFTGIDWTALTRVTNWHSPAVNPAFADEVNEIRRFVAAQFFDGVHHPNVRVSNLPELGPS